MRNTKDLLFVEIYKKILESNNVLILTHVNPDGDCLGASKALSDFILSINKKCSILVSPEIPKIFTFLNINNSINILTNSVITNNFLSNKYDLYIMLDAQGLNRCNFFEDIDYRKLIIFDHHIKTDNLHNDNGEALIFIDEKASSTCEIIFEFFYALSIKINKQIANSLLTGILTDTNSFINQATNTKSIKIAEKLINSGADTSLINKNINKNLEIKTLKFLELVLDRVIVNKKLNIVCTYFTIEDLNKYNLLEDNIPSISGLLNCLYNYSFVMVIKEIKSGVLEFSLRTNKEVDLSKISSFFGGGGHKKAAGFKILGNINEIL